MGDIYQGDYGAYSGGNASTTNPNQYQTSSAGAAVAGQYQTPKLGNYSTEAGVYYAGAMGAAKGFANEYPVGQTKITGEMVGQKPQPITPSIYSREYPSIYNQPTQNSLSLPLSQVSPTRTDLNQIALPNQPQFGEGRILTQEQSPATYNAFGLPMASSTTINRELKSFFPLGAQEENIGKYGSFAQMPAAFVEARLINFGTFGAGLVETAATNPLKLLTGIPEGIASIPARLSSAPNPFAAVGTATDIALEYKAIGKLTEPFIAGAEKISPVKLGSVKITTEGGETTPIYSGLTWKGKPLIGLGETGGIQIGLPKIASMPSLAKTEFPQFSTGNANLDMPKSKLETTILANADAMQAIGFRGDAIKLTGETLREAELLTPVKAEILGELPKTIKQAPPEVVKETLAYLQPFGEKGTNELYLGGSYGQFAFSGEGRVRLAHDIEVIMKGGTPERATAIVGGLAQHLQEKGLGDYIQYTGGYKLSARPTLKEEFGRDSTFIDLQFGTFREPKPQEGGSGSGIFGKAYGYELGGGARAATEGLEVRGLSEQYVAKFGSSLTRWQYEGEGKFVAPAAHRFKDAPDKWAAALELREQGADKLRFLPSEYSELVDISRNWRNYNFPSELAERVGGEGASTKIKEVYAEYDKNMAAYQKGEIKESPVKIPLSESELMQAYKINSIKMGEEYPLPSSKMNYEKTNYAEYPKNAFPSYPAAGYPAGKQAGYPASPYPAGKQTAYNTFPLQYFAGGAQYRIGGENYANGGGGGYIPSGGLYQYFGGGAYGGGTPTNYVGGGYRGGGGGGYPTGGYTGQPPILPPPKTPPINMFWGQKIIRRNTRLIRGKPPLLYVPSLEGIASGRTSRTIPRRLTGFEVRYPAPRVRGYRRLFR